ncbi:hypothetical protein L6R52_27670 [Myxococcota bacterium]|nr:hypothetical protein [Myxococcota bacterium]
MRSPWQSAAAHDPPPRTALGALLLGLLALVAPVEVRAADDEAEGADAAATSTVTRDPPAARSDFIKGNLIHLGTRELVSRFPHAGVKVGPRIIDKDFFLGVTPTVVVYPKPFALGLQVPLNLLAMRAGTQELSSFRIRREDWDEVSDFAKIVRFITYGRDESELYFTITSLRPYSLGHGQLIHHYQPSVDVDRSMTGAVFQAYNDFLGIQLDLNDVTFQNRVLGGLVFVKPLGFLESETLKSLSLGVEYAADLRAPRCVLVSETDRRCVPGDGNRAGFDPLTGQSLDDTFIRTDEDLGRPIVDETVVQALGFSGELKIVKTDDVDLKVYGTWHTFVDGGDGVAAGLLGRFNLGTELVSAFRTRTELRSFSARFAPAYFDTLYEVTKYQALSRGTGRWQVSPTKYQKVFGDPDNGFALDDEGRALGYNVELSWGLFRGSRSAKQLALGVGLTQSTRGEDTNFYAHAELPFLEVLQVFGSFLRLNAADLGDVFTGPLDNVVVLSGVRLQLLPILFVNAHYSRMFQIVAGPGHELHLGHDNVVDARGAPSPLFAQDRIYENVDALFLELELGWEFKE